MSKKKVAIIGIGALGSGMVETFAQHPHMELVAVCDVDPKKVEECTNKFSVRGFTNHLDLLEVELDMVYVAVPPKWHYQVAKDFILAGKHILCEKPLANSVEEAEDLLKMAKKAGIVHAMNFPLNYLNSTRKFAELLESGFIGQVRRVELTMLFPHWPRKWQENSWINTREQGGFVFEVSGHFIQLIQRFFGEISSIESELELPSDTSLPETGIISTMRLANNVPIVFNGITGVPGDELERLELTVYGTDGTISLIDLMKVKAGKVGHEFEELTIENNQFWDELISEFSHAIDGKPNELYDFKVGYDVQVVLETLRMPSLVETSC